jgi:hypothetical protein
VTAPGGIALGALQEFARLGFSFNSTGSGGYRDMEARHALADLRALLAERDAQAATIAELTAACNAALEHLAPTYSALRDHPGLRAPASVITVLETALDKARAKGAK